MKKIFFGLVLFFLAECAAPHQARHQDKSFESLNKLNNNLDSYSSALFHSDIWVGGDQINFENVIRIGKQKLGSHRYLAASIIFDNPRQKDFFDKHKYLGRGTVYYGYSSLSQKEAEKKALEYCNIVYEGYVDRWERNVGKARPHPYISCEIIFVYDFIKSIENKNLLKKNITQTRNLENEYERYLKQCEQIGFKRNTEKIGECALKIKDIEAKIQISNSQTIASQSSQQQNTQTTQSQNSSADTLANLVILNESIKLMNPPKRNFNCQARPFGIYTNIYCN